MLGQPRPEPALAAEQQHEHHARDDRRDRKGQIDERQEQVLAAEVELRDRPARADAEDQVGRHRDGGGQKRELHRGDGVGILHGCEVRTETVGKRLDEDRRQRQDQKEPEKREHDRDEHPPHKPRLGQLNGSGRFNAFVTLRFASS